MRRHLLTKHSLFVMALFAPALSESAEGAAKATRAPSGHRSAAGPSLDPPSPHAFDGARMREDVRHGLLREPLAVHGLEVVDLTGDRVPEIVVGNPNAWFVLEFDAERGRWVERMYHPIARLTTFGGEGIRSLRVADVDSDGEDEIVVLRGEGVLEFHDGASGTLEATHGVSLIDPLFTFHMEIRDFDGDGQPEVAVLEDAALHVFRPGAPEPEWSVPLLGARELAVGNLDLDDSLELVVGARNGHEVHVVDAGLQAIEWSAPDTSCDWLDVGDVDGDGLEEIAACGDEAECTVIEGDTRSRKWTRVGLRGDADVVLCVDVNGDGVAEVGFGDASGRDVLFLDGTTQEVVRSLEISGSHVGMNAMAFGDVDGDCTKELVFAMNANNTGPDFLFVADLDVATIEWTSLSIDGPWVASAVADIDADGRTELLRTAVDASTTAGALVFVTDVHARRDEWVPDGAMTDGSVRSVGMVTIQADADPQLEYVMADCVRRDCRAAAFDGLSHERDWVSPLFDAEEITAIAVANPDFDAWEEVVVGTNRTSSLGDGAHVRLLSGRDGSVLARSPLFEGNGAIINANVEDVDGDGDQEVAFLRLGEIHVHDALTLEPEWSNADAAASALTIADIVPGGTPELLTSGTGATGPDFVAYAGDGAHEEVFRAPMTGPWRANALRHADIDGDGIEEIIAAQFDDPRTDHSRVRVHASTDGRELWASPRMFGRLGDRGYLQVADIDDDGQIEIVVGGQHTLRAFEHDDADADVLAPSFDGIDEVAGIVTRTCCPSVDVRWAPARDDRSPPITYFVHRGTSPGFVVDASSRIATTRRTWHRDVQVEPATTYHYVVQAADSAGNVAVGSAGASIETESGLPPDPPSVSVRDPEPCSPSGVEVSFSPATPPRDVRFDLLRDGVTVGTDVTSPVLDVVGDSLAHEWTIRARKRLCELSRLAPAANGSDFGHLPPPSLDSVVDLDECARSGVAVTFTAVPLPPSGRHDLVVDGVVVAEGIVSPHYWQPPDSSGHELAVRSVDVACGMESISDAMTILDRGAARQPATNVRIEDTEPCVPGAVSLRFDHPGFDGPGHHELWRDGVVQISPVLDGTEFFLLDEAWHSYVVRSVDERCGVEVESDAVVHVEGSVPPLRPERVDLRDLAPCAAGTAFLRFEHPGFAFAGHYELRRDGVLVASPVESGQVVPVLAGAGEYVVRAVDDACGTWTDSRPVLHEDLSECGAGDPLIFVSRARPSGEAVTWEADPDVDRYDGHVGSLESLRAGVYDHVPTVDGARFTTSADPATGCALIASEGPPAIIEAMPADSYVIVVADDAELGAGPHGFDSFQRPRDDPALDPRPTATFCP